MKTAGVYEVTGTRIFRDHEPGEVFVALLDPRHEARALGRGSVRLIERRTIDLPAGKYQLPDGWLLTQEKEEA